MQNEQQNAQQPNEAGASEQTQSQGLSTTARFLSKFSWHDSLSFLTSATGIAAQGLSYIPGKDVAGKVVQTVGFALTPASFAGQQMLDGRANESMRQKIRDKRRDIQALERRKGRAEGNIYPQSKLDSYGLDSRGTGTRVLICANTLAQFAVSAIGMYTIWGGEESSSENLSYGLVVGTICSYSLDKFEQHLKKTNLLQELTRLENYENTLKELPDLAIVQNSFNNSLNELDTPRM